MVSGRDVTGSQVRNRPHPLILLLAEKDGALVLIQTLVLPHRHPYISNLRPRHPVSRSHLHICIFAHLPIFTFSHFPHFPHFHIRTLTAPACACKPSAMAISTTVGAIFFNPVSVSFCTVIFFTKLSTLTPLYIRA